jgi:hypothetical protein
MELSQIKGANLLVTGDFFPRPPQVGRESETANKTTIAIFKVVSVAEGGVLYFIHPTTKEMIVCSPIDAGSVSYELNERDATNPFRVLVAYNYITKQIVVTQGTPAAEPLTPELGANQLFIAAFTEQKQGDQQTIVEPPSPKVIYATFQELTNLKAANQIIAGQFYEMTDYATTHEINDSTNSGTTNIHVENTEPLLLLGLSSNEFQTQVYSKQFPKDIIHYDITNVRCEDRSTPRPGIITYRKDEWENETHFDFRGTKVYNGANNVYIFANRRNPGSSSFYGNKIGINDSYNNYFLFGNNCNSNTFGNNCSSNTLGDDCNSNTLGDECNSNILGDNCYSNILGDDCYSNILSDDCYSNILSDECNSNTLGSGCYSNTLGDNCSSNTLGDECNSNILGDNCYSNILGDDCYSNILSDDCNSNTLGSGCYSNTFGNDCNSNIFGNDCNSNILGYDCISNTFGDSCYSNILGDNCSLNTLNASSVGNIINKNCSYIAPEALNTSSILNTTFEANVSNVTYTAASTHLYASYHKVVFKYPNGTKKLRYFDNSGVLQVVDVNA